MNVEPDAESDIPDDPHSLDALDEAATLNETPPQVATGDPEPNAENYRRWLLERCASRRDIATSHDHRRLYEATVTILHGLVSAMRSPV